MLLCVCVVYPGEVFSLQGRECAGCLLDALCSPPHRLHQEQPNHCCVRPMIPHHHSQTGQQSSKQPFILTSALVLSQSKVNYLNVRLLCRFTQKQQSNRKKNPCDTPHSELLFIVVYSESHHKLKLHRTLNCQYMHH